MPKKAEKKESTEKLPKAVENNVAVEDTSKKSTKDSKETKEKVDLI